LVQKMKKRRKVKKQKKKKKKKKKRKMKRKKRKRTYPEWDHDTIELRNPATIVQNLIAILAVADNYDHQENDDLRKQAFHSSYTGKEHVREHGNLLYDIFFSSFFAFSVATC